MPTEIIYESPAAFQHHGRNGYIKACGIAVTEIGDEVFLNAIASKGETDAARLVIPRPDIPALVAALDKIATPRLAGDEALIASARDAWASDDLQIDAAPKIAPCKDGGAWVQAWVWVAA